MVEDHSKKWKHTPPSYVVFCTVSLPPKFCSLHLPPNPPEPEIAMWVPPPNFRNRYDELKKLNTLILELNKVRQVRQCVRMDYHGVKRFNSGTVQHRFDTRPGATQIWREKDVFRKLHFTMDIKMKLAGHVSSCFKINSNRN